MLKYLDNIKFDIIFTSSNLKKEAMKWRPSKTVRKEFAIKMQNPIEKATYEARKSAVVDKRRSKSRFDYNTAGGTYIATETQYDFAMNRPDNLTPEQIDACNQIIYSFTCKEKVSHDCIHLINELIRANSSNHPII